MIIDAILAQNDLLHICERDGAVFKKTVKDWRSACPLHKGEDKTAFAVWNDGDKQRWKCYSGNCGQGDVIDYVIIRDNLDLKRAIEVLGGRGFITPEEARAAAEERRRRAEIYEAQKRYEYEHALAELRGARAWERYFQNLCDNQEAQRLWRKRGIPDDWQAYWNLGYCPDFHYKHDDNLYHSPSLTIPIFNGDELPANIRHRLLDPIDPNDKYRPDRPGLKALPFMADLSGNELQNVIVCEGEIKAMVTYVCLDSDKWQIYGIPGKTAFRELVAQLKGKSVWIAFDPDAGEQAIQAAQLVEGRIISLRVKIDDAINNNYLTTIGLRNLITNAKKVK